MADLEHELRRLKQAVERKLGATMLEGTTREPALLSESGPPQVSTDPVGPHDAAALGPATNPGARERVLNARRADLGWLMSLLRARILETIGSRRSVGR